MMTIWRIFSIVALQPIYRNLAAAPRSMVLALASVWFTVQRYGLAFLAPVDLPEQSIPFQTSGSRPTKHEDHPYHSRAEANAGAEELDDVHSAIRLEARALRHPVKSDETNQQWDNPDHNRRPFAINHCASVGTIVTELCGLTPDC
jgi:hypothetical protein